MISERTKAALQAAKARGKRLGQPKGHKIPSDLATRARGSAANAANAQAFAERLRRNRCSATTFRMMS
jgi:DNA invertase Pin-like site-specific DNA recombinase